MPSPRNFFDMTDAEEPRQTPAPAVNPHAVDGWFTRAANRKPERLTGNRSVEDFLAMSGVDRPSGPEGVSPVAGPKL